MKIKIPLAHTCPTYCHKDNTYWVFTNLIYGLKLFNTKDGTFTSYQNFPIHLIPKTVMAPPVSLIDQKAKTLGLEPIISSQIWTANKQSFSHFTTPSLLPNWSQSVESIGLYGWSKIKDSLAFIAFLMVTDPPLIFAHMEKDLPLPSALIPYGETNLDSWGLSWRPKGYSYGSSAKKAWLISPGFKKIRKNKHFLGSGRSNLIHF